jgi:hypothetical protein
MKRLRALMKHLPIGPPTGPLTTDEAAKAEEKRQKTLAKDDKRLRENDQEPNSNSP